MKINSKLREVIKRCQKSPDFFIETFGKVRHPMAGEMDFKLFKYQKRSLDCFRDYRYNIYKKVRQCGISTITGIYAMWLAMFIPHATVLIVSKRDEDSKEFMSKNIKFPYERLPKQLRAIWGDLPEIYSMHHIMFRNGSSIKCLPSGPNTLRANSSTLNVIDEAAFMPHMDEMWAGGAPTLIMGGSVIVISTTKGKGNWYHSTWEDAEAKQNEFNPIEIDWWEMDWEIGFPDPHTGQLVTIAPTNGIRETTPEEVETYGPYWSPWLEEQYRALQEKGEAWKFRQEILASFEGTGNTVLDVTTLMHIEKQRSDDFGRIRSVEYIHPVTERQVTLDFEDQLWVWKKPVRPTRDTIEGGKIIKPGESGHTYTIGVDVSTGEASDYSTVQIFDVDAKEQVAELNIKVLPSILTMMVDYIARWYNNALVVCERTGIGQGVAADLGQQVGYHNLFRMRMPNGTRSKKVGYPTTAASKPAINKCLMDMLGEDNFKIYSHRLYRQLSMYVYLTEIKTGAEPGPGNHDDLCIAAGLALIGVQDAVMMDSTAMIPTRGAEIMLDPEINRDAIVDQHRKYAAKGGMNLLMPVTHGPSNESKEDSIDRELQKFTTQLGGLTMDQAKTRVSHRKHVIKRGKYSR